LIPKIFLVIIKPIYTDYLKSENALEIDFMVAKILKNVLSLAGRIVIFYAYERGRCHDHNGI